MKGSLYIIATPIGNLEDITLRALRVLKEVDLIACEDTRETWKLLTHYGLKGKRLISFFEGNEVKRVPELIEYLSEGKNIGLVSKAGTPGISDPGYRLIREAISEEIPLNIIPGPCALVSSLVISGLPTDSFYFKGFLPRRQSRRRSELEELKECRSTLIFYESPYRLKETLFDIKEILGERQAVVAKEITKKFEKIWRRPISELIEAISNEKVLRGEYMILVERKKEKDEGSYERKD